MAGWAHLAELGGWLALLGPAGQLALAVVVVVAVLATDDVTVPLVGAVAAPASAPYSPLPRRRSVLRRAPFRRSSTSSTPARVAPLAPAGSNPAGEKRSMGTRAVMVPPSADKPDSVVLPRLQRAQASSGVVQLRVGAARQGVGCWVQAGLAVSHTGRCCALI